MEPMYFSFTSLALKGYLTLSHSFFDKTSAVAVGGMNGTHFYTSVYRKAVAADRNAVSITFTSLTYVLLYTLLLSFYLCLFLKVKACCFS